MVDESFTVRRASGEDALFLTDMLVEAVNWHPRRRMERRHILATRELAHYISGWPRPGDLGVVAESAGASTGAAWLRFFPVEDPGYGFLAPAVPELTIGVVGEYRRRGVGRMLLRGLMASAWEAGIPRISLSVERANPARLLYLAEGFAAVAGDEGADTMIKSLP